MLEGVGRSERVVIARHGVPTAVPVRASEVTPDSLKDRRAPPPEAVLAPMTDDELDGWNAEVKPALLDTHARVRVLTADAKPPDTAKEAILRAPLASVCAISLYQIGQGLRLVKLEAMAPLARELVDIASKDGVYLTLLNLLQAVKAWLLDWTHRDPFDRIIAAVALGENATIVSSDSAFDALGDVTRSGSGPRSVPVSDGLEHRQPLKSAGQGVRHGARPIDELLPGQEIEVPRQQVELPR